ncbi:MAG: thioredoxin family protein [Planctomycetales bacterium]|nr:thioredoxin family protein [Planctomycetales bacterium]
MLSIHHKSWRTGWCNAKSRAASGSRQQAASHSAALVIFLYGLVAVSHFFLVSQRAAAGNQDTLTVDAVRVATAWSVDRSRPGDTAILAIVADIQRGFHINADERQIQPFDDFKPYPTRVEVIDVPETITIAAPLYPKAVPLKVQYAAGDLMSFEGQTIIYLPVKLAETIHPGRLDLKLEFAYQACADNYCLFPKIVGIEASLAVVEPGSGVSKINAELFSAYSGMPAAAAPRSVYFALFNWSFSIDVTSAFGFGLLLLTAACGGALLNFTPCVLPLIPIKMISLSHAAQNRKQCVMLGTAMFLGVLAFWLALGVLIALVNEFSAANQLFQYPAFTILVGVIIAAMATGMFGVFSVHLPGFFYMLNPEQKTLHGSFGVGILAAILSTPCTAPFMGTAAAWAATQAPATSLITFAAIGMGMAFPYLVLSASPALVAKIPKTGPVSQLIKQIMGLLMLAAAAYFIGVGLSAMFTSPPDPPSRVYWWPVMLFCAIAGGWLAYRTVRMTARVTLRTVFAVIGTLCITLSAWGAVKLSDAGPIKWQYYSPEKFEKALNQKKVVVMVFTAEWCLNCKALEQGTLTDAKIVALFADENIVPMKVDLTANNPAGKAKLREVGHLTIPLLVIFAPTGEQVFQSDFYTVVQLVNAVTKTLEDATAQSKDAAG